MLNQGDKKNSEAGEDISPASPYIIGFLVRQNNSLCLS